MNYWKIKYKLFKVNVIQELKYFAYRFKSAIGIKTIGYGKYDGLVLMKLLGRYKPSIYSMHVVSTDDNLDSIDLEAVHDYGIRLDKADYLSIILNPKDRQVRVVTGENLRTYITDATEIKIEKAMQNKVDAGEILGGLELGMKKIKHCLIKVKILETAMRIKYETYRPYN